MKNSSAGTVTRKKDLSASLGNSFNNRDTFLSNGLGLLTTTNFNTGSTYLSASNLLSNVNT